MPSHKIINQSLMVSILANQSVSIYSVIPAHSPKNTGHYTGHLEKNYRTFYRTSEANFVTLVRNYCISAVFYK